MPPIRQLPLKFPEAALSFEEMTLTPSNESAVRAIRNTERWPYHAFCLVGAARSGLTTIAMAWSVQRQARFLSASEFVRLTQADLEKLSSTDFVIDDTDQLEDGHGLLFALSAAKRHGNKVLLTSHLAPERWSFQSPDLRSRMKAAPLASLSAPDEELMRARLRRAFARTLIDLPEAVEDYLVTRLGLSYERIEDTAELLSGAAGERALTIPLAREMLGAPSDGIE